MILASKKFIRNQNGGAVVAISLLMALVVLSAFVQNIIIWGQALAAEENDRVNEQIDIEAIYFVEEQLNVDIRNTGEVAVHLVALWINDTRYEIDYHLNIEESTIGIGNDLILTPIPQASKLQIVTVYTERGNFDTDVYALETTGGDPMDVGAAGVFKIDWFYNEYSSIGTGGVQSDTGVIWKNDTYVAFYVNITNKWQHNCTILPISFLTLTSLSTIGAHEEPNFFIVNNVSYGGSPVLTPYNNVDDVFTVYPNSSKILVFAAYTTENDWKYGGTLDDWRWGTQCPTYQSGSEGAGIQISLFYYSSNDPEKIFGQTISTQAIILL